MIRLGVFDLEGTLLTRKGKLPETFYRDVDLLARRNVSAAIVSGRPARLLFEMFDRDSDLLISGVDGNVFFRGKKLLHARFISPELICKVQAITEEREDMAIVFSGLYENFVSDEHYRRFCAWGMRRFMPDAPRDLTAVENICKIHLFCRGGVKAAKHEITASFGEIKQFCDVRESGYGWIGIMEKDSNKASAVRFFQEYLGIDGHETAVFGDSSNDVPMFKLADYAFAMKNAPADIQQKASYVTDEDNDHNGAMKALIRLTE